MDSHGNVTSTALGGINMADHLGDFEGGPLIACAICLKEVFLQIYTAYLT